MKTIVTIFLILAAGTVLGFAINFQSLVPGNLDQANKPGACKQEMIKGDPFEIFEVPKISYDS